MRKGTDGSNAFTHVSLGKNDNTSFEDTCWRVTLFLELDPQIILITHMEAYESIIQKSEKINKLSGFWSLAGEW